MPSSSPFHASPRFARTVQRAISLATLLATVAVAPGCVAASNPQEPTARVIVRFRPGSPDPADAAFRARLASSAHVSRIDLLRPMSGDAYVMTVACADPTRATSSNAADSCASAIARIAATEWVVLIENDGRERHQ